MATHPPTAGYLTKSNSPPTATSSPLYSLPPTLRLSSNIAHTASPSVPNPVRKLGCKALSGCCRTVAHMLVPQLASCCSRPTSMPFVRRCWEAEPRSASLPEGPVPLCIWTRQCPPQSVPLLHAQTWATMLLTSPVLEGRRSVLDSLASLENAETYCSATDNEAAALPFWEGGEGDREQTTGRREEEIQPSSPPPPGPFTISMLAS